MSPGTGRFRRCEIEPSSTGTPDTPSAGRIELANALFEYFEIFHNRCRHSTLGMLTRRVPRPEGDATTIGVISAGG